MIATLKARRRLQAALRGSLRRMRPTLTHISLATLRRWRLENRGPKYRKFGSLVRYDEDELSRWEEAQPFGGDAPDQRITPRSVPGADLLRRAG
jgi:hypothetical protein